MTKPFNFPYAQIQPRTWINELLQWNSLTEYAVGIFTIIGAVILVNIIQRFIKKRLDKNDTPVAVYTLQMLPFLSPLILVLITFTVVKYYSASDTVTNFLHTGFKVAFIILITRAIAAAIRTAIYGYLKHQGDTGGKFKQVRGIVIILSGIIWLLGFVFMFDNLGFNVTAVLTGLGVGGIAIALAAQTILGDIFNYFVIFFDQPFEVGDFIIVDDKMGTVEYVGIKTTRIRSLS